MERTLRAEELARDVEGLAADNHDLLAVEELLGNNAGKTAKQVALAIDNDLVEEVWLAIRSQLDRSPSLCDFAIAPSSVARLLSSIPPRRTPCPSSGLSSFLLSSLCTRQPQKSRIVGGRELLTTCSKLDIFARSAT
jgi:hypothetical protein